MGVDVATLGLDGDVGNLAYVSASSIREIVDPYRAGLPVDGFSPERCGA